MKVYPLVLAIPLLFSANAMAATSSTQITLTIDVGSGCGITATNVDFGSLVSSASSDEQFDVTIECTTAANGNLTFVSSGASGTTRYMVANASDQIAYEILANGTAVSNTDTVSTNVPAASSVTTQFTARRSTLATIPPPGTYTDTVDITYTF
ncbi:spore coat protein U domain-containing protein [uncultured Umboniibacter sp.]|uniref:spore coat protein U domain-containing protein n=1 Tax=uncultured Umboniibacter sp. TaxID=1798917 RepID=UPI002630AC99|nr:spore coat protein U domain-containing protein [uncultured Umboniibacter sp.]